MYKRICLFPKVRVGGSNPPLTAVSMDLYPPTSNSSNYKTYVIVLDVRLS